MDWIEDIGLGVSRIQMAFKTMGWHEAILGEGIETGKLGT